MLIIISAEGPQKVRLFDSTNSRSAKYISLKILKLKIITHLSEQEKYKTYFGSSK